MGLSFHKFILFLAVGAVGFGAPGLALADIASCVSENNANIKSVDEQLKAFGVDPANPCPEQDKYDKDGNCSESVKDLHGVDKNLRELMTEKCQNAEALRNIPSEATGEQKKSNDASSKLLAKAKNIGQRELGLLKKARKEINEIREYYADLAKGAEELQKKVEDKARTDAQGRDEHAAKLKAQNNEQAKNFFKDSLSTVGQAVNKAKGTSGISKDEVDQVQTKLTKEPLAISAAAADWDKQVAAREKVVQSQIKMYDTNYGTTTSQSKNLGASSDDKTAGKTGEGTSSSGGSDTPGMGDAAKAAQAAQAASGMAGGGASGGGGSEGASSAASPSSPSSAYAPTSTSTPGGSSAANTTANNSSTPGSTALGTHVGKSTTGPDTSGKIENLGGKVASPALPLMPAVLLG